MNKFSQAHEFAFFYPALSEIKRTRSYLDTHEITDPELVHRLGTVLRLSKSETLILFDTHHNLHAVIARIEPKKSILIEILSIEPNTILEPAITWILPMLKRDAFEAAIYTLAELGVQTIQPVLTSKIHKVITTEKELMRYRKIMIAACEQAKQFIIPDLKPLLPFALFLPQIASVNENLDAKRAKIFFDAQGDSCFEIIKKLDNQKISEVIACTGPEADLTELEKQLLRDQGFNFCALTKTTLRAEQAITVGAGILRSCL